jgi:hypothetical protein
LSCISSFFLPSLLFLTSLVSFNLEECPIFSWSSRHWWL